MATYTKNGIVVNFSRDGRGVSFQVVSQSAAATAIIKNRAISVDGWNLKVNKRPDVDRTDKSFYLRGSEADKNDKVIIKEFDDMATAKAAEKALPKLLDLVVGASYQVVKGDKVTPAAAYWALAQLRGVYSNAARNGEAYVVAFHRLVTALRGPDSENEAKKKATSKIRQAVFGRSVAQMLKVTGQDEYPVGTTWTTAQNPPVIACDHLQEHVNQAWDVLDKALNGR